MSSKRIARLLMGGLAALVLLISIGSATAVDAQDRRFHRPRRVFFPRRIDPFWHHNIHVVDSFASRSEQGYTDGREQGKDDAKDGKDFDPDDHKRFDKSRSLAYREAFLKGYSDGYRRQMKKDN